MSKINRLINNYITKIIHKHLLEGKYKIIKTRFPPEPNGYLHIGHAKSIFLNFEIAKFYKGQFILRFDDTNPIEEQQKYVDAIKYDVIWLLENNDIIKNITYTSNYFNQFYNYAIELIQKGLAYVDQLSIHEIHEYRGTLKNPGKNSPFRNREIKENLKLFADMKNRKFSEGSACLRAKIDMSSDFIVMRDPVLYRIKFSPHYKTLNQWCIYPTYDFTHCLADAIEGITHSLCTLEFQDNRRLYNWILNNISSIKHFPTQYEYARLNFKNINLSKRKINSLIQNNIINDWDDPRIPTISGLRRRGYTPTSIKLFCKTIGITKQNSFIEQSVLESCILKELNNNAIRSMAILNPILIIIQNISILHEEYITVNNHPNHPNMGSHEIIFTKKIYIDQSDLIIDIQNKQLILGEKIKLRHAYIIQIDEFETNNSGEIIKIFCSYDPNSLNYIPKYDTNKKIRIVHWVSAIYNIKSEFRLFNSFYNFNNNNVPIEYKYSHDLDTTSLKISKGFIEYNIFKYIIVNKPVQFEREGYFYADIYDSSIMNPVFNRIISLKKKF